MTRCVPTVTPEMIEVRLEEIRVMRWRYWRLRTRLNHQIERKHAVSPALLNETLDLATKIADTSRAIEVGLPGAIQSEAAKVAAANDVAQDTVGQTLKTNLTEALASLNRVNGVVNPPKDTNPGGAGVDVTSATETPVVVTETPAQPPQ